MKEGTAMRLRLFPEPPRAIAKRRGMAEREAAEMPESMAKKGLVLRVRGGRAKNAALPHAPSAS